LVIAHQIEQKYDLKYKTAKDIYPIKNKDQMRSLLEAKGVNNVPYIKVESKDQLAEFVAKVGPVVLKPFNGVGSKNVVKITEVSDCFDSNLVNNNMIAEKFIGGKEYSVETFSFEGKHKILGITEKGINETNFVEQNHVFPAEVQEQDKELIYTRTTDFLNDIGIINGPSHTELKLQDGQIYFIETHNRVAGDCITNLVEMVTGVNIFDYMISWPCSKKSFENLTFQENGVASVEFLFSTSGLITEISGVESSRTVPGVVDIVINKKVNDVIEDTSSSFNRLGYILVKGDSKSDCIDTIEEVKKRIKITVKPI
jgi:biotin carboxylase